MKNGLRVCIILIFAVFIFSCGKDVPNTPAPPPVTNSSDSQLVISTMVYSSIQNPGNSFFKYQFEYDVLKRVTKMTGLRLKNGAYSPEELSTYYYQGNDTLAFKKTVEAVSGSAQYSGIWLYYYDNQQRLMKDSSNDGSYIEVNDYKYLNNQIVSSGYVSHPADSTIYPSNDTAFLNGTGQVIQVNASYPFNSTSVTYSYDTHPGVLNLLNIRSTYRPFPINNHLLEDFVAIKNNVISIDNFQPIGNIVTQAWTYDNSGFPNDVNITFSGSPNSDLNVAFLYKKL